MTGLIWSLQTLLVSSTVLAVAEMLPADVIDAGGALSRMTATAILGVVAVSAIWAVIYLVRLVFGKLLPVLEENAKAAQRVADVIAKCEERQTMLRESGK